MQTQPGTARIPAIAVQDLVKSYGETIALNGISFSVRSGELFGFLGPNGAGKTTTINLLTGLARPDAGVIHVGGIDCTAHPRAAQAIIGVVPDESNLYPELSGYANLTFCGSLYGLGKRQRRERARKLLRAFDLEEAGDRKFEGYSRGMKRKLAIAAGIIHEPAILFLDEPTTGIDVASARRVRRIITDLHAAGTTIFLTTHMIEEAERLCQRIAFIVSGRIVRIDTLENLLQPIQDRHLLQILCTTEPIEVMERFTSAFPDLRFTVEEKQITAEAAHPLPVGPLVRFLEEAGVEVLEARRLLPSLEEVFIRITGIAAEEMRRKKERS